ncbi:hypothetical protein F5Y00DRAFT_270007 [Daldinia vernicosa]|uniref:uncharacterized protein n=1 Tax=Daldinia vernicosa TaxID=114800 RepID=UPI002007CA91|nr:uncharacterized protein F5Y00DRAFT_270007 [Daldinia vernicosa]KAI0848795.1 hypothetical protein F5Y00DRAFT_270007 [Daldinia vernicosa]
MANRQLIDDLGLNWSSGQRDEFLAKIKVVELPKYKSLYPSTDLFSAGMPEASHQWQGHWKDSPPRNPCYNEGLHQGIADWDYLPFQYIVPHEESVIFRDIETKETVLVVLRDFIPDEDLRNIMMRVCREIVKTRLDDEREDPKLRCDFGYTCCSQQDPEIRLAASCIKLNTEEEIELDDTAQGVAGIVWNLMKSRFPPEITDNNTNRENGFPRISMTKDGASFTFKAGGEDVEFETGEDGSEQPPLPGMSGVYYARHTHTEVDGNSWIIACTVNTPDSTTANDNLYLASYGIMVLPTTNTASAWRPWDYHSASLYKKESGPEDRAEFEVHNDEGLDKDTVFEILKSLKAARKRSNWLDDRRKWKVTKPTLPRTGWPFMNVPEAESPKLQSPKPEPASHRYKLRPRITKPRYCVDSESFTDSEASDSDSGSEFEAEPTTPRTGFKTNTDNCGECITVKTSPTP